MKLVLATSKEMAALDAALFQLEETGTVSSLLVGDMSTSAILVALAAKRSDLEEVLSLEGESALARDLRADVARLERAREANRLASLEATRAEALATLARMAERGAL